MQAKAVKTFKVPVGDGTVDMVGTVTISKPQKVFVVHGRDDLLRSSIFDFLSSIRLKPLKFIEAIELTGQSSPYIAQILESAFENAQAIVPHHHL